MKRLLFFSAMLFIIYNNLHAQVKVNFSVTDLPDKTPTPKTIYLGGSFNNWNPADDNWKLFNDGHTGLYTRTLTMNPGNYEYKVTRGNWTTVECGKLGIPIENHMLHIVHDTIIQIKIADWIDNYPKVEKKHTASKQVHIISATFNIPQLNRQRRVWIYLPKGYESSTKKYPVIYMHDGQNLFDEYTSGYGEWGIDEFLDQLLPTKQQAIIVGIDHGDAYRTTEYDPYNSTYGQGSGDAYARFLVETLKPYIDKQYRTLKNAHYTTVAGSSMGGLISMYIALKYPHVFGNAGIFSPSFWIAPPIYDYAKTRAVKTSRFYFVCGDAESEKEVSEMTKMVSVLKAHGFKNRATPVTIVKGARHNEKQWQNDFPAFYNWLVSGF